MRYFTTILSIILLSVMDVQAVPTASWSSHLPASALRREIVNLRFYGLWFGVYHSDRVLRFQSTVIMPRFSGKGAVGLWPGLVTKGAVLQNVIENQGSKFAWRFSPFYCCDPYQLLQDSLPGNNFLYPGDTLTQTYSQDTFSDTWHDSYDLIPGPNGHAAGMKSAGGSFIFDQNTQTNTTDPFTAALITMELQGDGDWDFGPLSWRDIIFEVDTLDTKWCTEGPMLGGGANFTFNYSQPVVFVVDNVIRCYIAELNFISK